MSAKEKKRNQTKRILRYFLYFYMYTQYIYEYVSYYKKTWKTNPRKKLAKEDKEIELYL